MKILLINPPIPLSYYNREYYIPSGLLYLAAVLSRNKEEVKILDLKTLKLENPDTYFSFYAEKIRTTILEFSPDLIGFGCLYSGHFPDILSFSSAIKEDFPRIPIVVGGIHPTIYPYEILQNCPSIDWVVLGEGEESFAQLVDTLKEKHYEFDKIDGFAYRQENQVKVNAKTNFIKDLDALPFPAYELINFADYYVDTVEWLNPKGLTFYTSVPIITSRSCPNRCNFCSMYTVMGPRWRPRSAANVVDEIEYVYKKYNQRHFSFMDDNLTLNREHILGICNQIIKRKLNIHFETPNGVATNTLDEEVLNAMVSAGLTRISLAIESGSDFIRNQIMHKRLSSEKIYEIIRLTKKYKQLYVKVFFIIGLPEETKETLMDTYDMIKKIDVDRIYLSNIVPFPGTKVFKQAVKDNLLVDVDPNNLYKSEELYITNYSRFFIKPYNLDLRDLYEFRVKCDDLIARQKTKKEMLKKRSKSII